MRTTLFGVKKQIPGRGDGTRNTGFKEAGRVTSPLKSPRVALLYHELDRLQSHIHLMVSVIEHARKIEENVSSIRLATAKCL